MTDTNQASELYELCKEVYKRTGWDDKSAKRRFVTREIVDDADLGGNTASFYTSDYLLEKLPKQYRQYWLRLEPLQFTENHIRWRAYYQEDETLAVGEYANEESPIKALLKLTIALSEAGELNDQSS